MEKVKITTDDSGHWYIIPNCLYEQFKLDLYNEIMIDSGEFDDIWGRYRSGGDINLIQLYAEI